MPLPPSVIWRNYTHLQIKSSSSCRIRHQNLAIILRTDELAVCQNIMNKYLVQSYYMYTSTYSCLLAVCFTFPSQIMPKFWLWQLMRKYISATRSTASQLQPVCMLDLLV